VAKSELTLKLEKHIYKITSKMGVFGCFEVTIGWFGKERVDYLTFDTKGIWRCYEIKISKADFNSKSKNTFVGHFNYYVMPMELYKQVKDEIPAHIGVYTESNYIGKKARKQNLTVDEQILKNSLIRSLCRDVEKIYDNNNPLEIEALRRRLREAESQVERYRSKYFEMRWKLQEVGM
jgi:hypothetical protein